MEQYYFYRSWMYDRTFPGRTALKPGFKEGIRGFVAHAMSQESFRTEEGIRCPCLKCMCRYIESPQDVIKHLESVGFVENYWVWVNHGEQMPNINIGIEHASSSGVHMEYDEQIDVNMHASGDTFGLMGDMVGDALGVNLSYNERCDEEQIFPNEKAQDFYRLLNKMNKPLFEGSSYSKLSMCVRLLAAKANWNVPEQCMEFFTKMMLDATPIKDNMPTSYYDAKRLVAKLGLEYQKIDCCIQGCMLFYDNEFGTNDGALEECKFCNAPRYHVANDAVDNKQKRVQVKKAANQQLDQHGAMQIWKEVVGKATTNEAYGARCLPPNLKTGRDLFQRVYEGESTSNPSQLTSEVRELIEKMAQQLHTQTSEIEKERKLREGTHRLLLQECERSKTFEKTLKEMFASKNRNCKRHHQSSPAYDESTSNEDDNEVNDEDDDASD